MVGCSDNSIEAHYANDDHRCICVVNPSISEGDFLTLEYQTAPGADNQARNPITIKFNDIKPKQYVGKHKRLRSEQESTLAVDMKVVMYFIK
jgi:hypothetical protein